MNFRKSKEIITFVKKEKEIIDIIESFDTDEEKKDFIEFIFFKFITLLKHCEDGAIFSDTYNAFKESNKKTLKAIGDSTDFNPIEMLINLMCSGVLNDADI